MTPTNPDERKRLIEASIAAFYQHQAAEKVRLAKTPTRFKRNRLKPTK